MATIYLSSTYGDLKDYREAVARILRKMGHNPVAMEDYVATGQAPPLAKCLADVADCDLYVGIFAWRYGFIPDGDNPDKRSITELEYRQAERLQKPSFIFLLEETAQWSPDFRDSYTGAGECGKRIADFRQELSHNKLVSFFDSPDRLAGLVAAAVGRWASDRPSSPRKQQAKSPPSLPSAIALGVGSVALLGGSVWLWQGRQSTELARSLAGHWQAEVNYSWGIKHTENLQIGVADQKIEGVVTFLGRPRPIAEGQLTTDGLEFTTLMPEMNPQNGSNTQREYIYRGRLEGNELKINLTRQGGIAPPDTTSFVARKKSATSH